MASVLKISVDDKVWLQACVSSILQQRPADLPSQSSDRRDPAGFESETYLEKITDVLNSLGVIMESQQEMQARLERVEVFLQPTHRPNHLHMSRGLSTESIHTHDPTAAGSIHSHNLAALEREQEAMKQMEDVDEEIRPKYVGLRSGRASKPNSTPAVDSSLPSSSFKSPPQPNVRASTSSAVPTIITDGFYPGSPSAQNIQSMPNYSSEYDIMCNSMQSLDPISSYQVGSRAPGMRSSAHSAMRNSLQSLPSLPEDTLMQLRENMNMHLPDGRAEDMSQTFERPAQVRPEPPLSFTTPTSSIAHSSHTLASSAVPAGHAPLYMHFGNHAPSFQKPIQVRPETFPSYVPTLSGARLSHAGVSRAPSHTHSEYAPSTHSMSHVTSKLSAMPSPVTTIHSHMSAATGYSSIPSSISARPARLSTVQEVYNKRGMLMRRSQRTGTFNRFSASSAAPGGYYYCGSFSINEDGSPFQCGPTGGPQCKDCIDAQAEYEQDAITKAYTAEVERSVRALTLHPEFASLSDEGGEFDFLKAATGDDAMTWGPTERVLPEYGNTRKFWRCKTMIHPFSAQRALWDVTSLLCVIVDGVMLPLTAFEDFSIPHGLLLSTAIFWLLDIVVSFRTGYYDHITQEVEMAPWNIAKKYARSWFVLDLVVVLPSVWEITYGEETRSSPLMMRIGNVLRILRFLRILRLIKLTFLVKNIGLVARMHFVKPMLHAGFLVLLLVLVCHMLACAWYAIGIHAVPAGLLGWARKFGFEEDAWFERYLVCFHWAISQFHGTYTIYLDTYWEHLFSIIALFLALMSTSLFVGHIITLISQQQHYYAQRVQRRRMMDKFLAQYPLPNQLKAEAASCAEDYMSELKEEVDPQAMYDMLGWQLQQDIRKKIFRQFLVKHPFFRACAKRPVHYWLVDAMAKYIVQHRHILRDSVVFDEGEQAQAALIVMVGRLEYLRLARSRNVEVKDWVLDPALWLRWVSLGCLTSIDHVEICAIPVQELISKICYRQDTRQFAASFASKYLAELRLVSATEVTDLFTLKN